MVALHENAFQIKIFVSNRNIISTNEWNQHFEEKNKSSAKQSTMKRELLQANLYQKLKNYMKRDVARKTR